MASGVGVRRKTSRTSSSIRLIKNDMRMAVTSRVLTPGVQHNTVAGTDLLQCSRLAEVNIIIIIIIIIIIMDRLAVVEVVVVVVAVEAGVFDESIDSNEM